MKILRVLNKGKMYKQDVLGSWLLLLVYILVHGNNKEKNGTHKIGNFLHCQLLFYIFINDNQLGHRSKNGIFFVFNKIVQ